MTTKEKIEQDYVREVKARNESAVSMLRMIRAALKNAEIEKRSPLEEEDVIAVLNQEMKKLNDSLDSFTQAGRQDLVAKTGGEREILKAYLPDQMDDDELDELIRRTVEEAGEVTEKDFGRLMGMVMKQAKNRADGTKVSAMLKKMLAGDG
ncbi:hypothetical protein AMJ57_04650 [Parcubacteria bacterium SG8_24]|nr:MAG: hypothetical protein AMJ57_04650 [Parcubacteria bacterium SG8_24]